MKKSLLTLAVVGAMMLTSCSNDEIAAPAGDGNVTFNVSLPSGMQSRAFSDGTQATQVKCYVYDQSNAAGAASVFTKDVTMTGLTGTVSFDLISGRTYDFVFVAVADPAKVKYTDAARTITVDYSDINSNYEKLDAFYKTETFKITGAIEETVELRRPYAQLNIGTDDKSKYCSALNVNVLDMPHVGVEVTNVYSTLDVMTGNCTGEAATVTFKPVSVPTASEGTFPYSEETRTFEYLAMNYLLVPSSKDLVDVKMTVGANDEFEYPNVPVQRNYRTNIYGSLLTDPANFNVIIKPDYETPDNKVDYDSEDYRVANTVSEVNSLFAAGEPKVAIDGTKVTAVSRADANPALISLNKAVKAQALKILGVSAAPVKVAYAALADGATEATEREFRLVVTGTLSAAEFDLPEAGVKLEGRQNENGEKASVPNVTITNAASAAVTGEVAVENIAKGDGVTADVEFEGAVELTTTDADSFYSALADDAVDKINVPSTANIDIKDKAIVSISRNLTISIEGTVNTCREQIGVTGSGNVLTVTGSGTVTSKGVQDAKGNRPLNSYDGATLVVRNITVETEQNNGGSSIFSENGDIELEKVTINSHNFAIGANGGALKVKDCVINSDSNNKEGAFSYTLSVASGCKAVLENTQVTGIQGAVTVQGEGSECIIKSGTYKTVDHKDYADIAFYAVYATDKGVAIIEGGDFSSPTDRSPNKIAEGNSALVAGDNDVDMPDGNFIIKGGRFSGKAYNHVKNALCELPDGYEYRALTDAGDYKWEVVKK